MQVSLNNSNVTLTESGRHLIKISEPTLLSLPTYEGSGQAVHPSVLFFPVGRNGWRYWMAATPYPNGNDDYENPSIFVSNDGLKWQVPAGLTNPVIPAPADVATGGYNSDPCLLHDGTNFILYYRNRKADATNYLYRTTSADGVTWAVPTLCSFAADAINANLQPPAASIDPICPSIIRISSSVWYCYYTQGNKIYRAKSTDGIAFAHPKEVFHNMPSSMNMWHFGITHSGTGWHGLVAAYSIYESNMDNELFYGYSADGVKWRFDRVAALTPLPGTFYSRQIYKSCLVFNPSTNGVRVYVSTTTDEVPGKWWTGYFDAALAHIEPKLDIHATKSLVQPTDNISIVASGSLQIGTLTPFGKNKVTVSVRLTANANFSVLIDYLTDPHGNFTAHSQTVITGGTARLMDGATFDPQGPYGFLKIVNNDAATLTLHTVQITLFPD